MSDLGIASTAERRPSLDAASILLRSASRRLGEARALAASSAFSIMALSIFAAAASSPSFRGVLPVVDSARRLLSVSSWAIAFFVALSGWFYAEGYLRRRKRELASWLLLGMRRRKAVMAASAEFAAISLVALASGLGLGALFSRFFALVLAALMSERSPIPMPFGAESVAAAAIACAAQWAVSTARAALIIRRATLTELMKAERAAEAPPKRRTAPAIVGCALVAAGYAAAAIARDKTASSLTLPVLAATVAGTFLAFAAAVPALIGAARSRLAGRDAAALVSMAQLSFRSRRNSRIAAFSAVLVAIAASALGTVLALRANDESMARWSCPHDLELSRSTPESVALVESVLDRSGIADAESRRVDLEWIAARLSIGGEAYDIQVFSESTINVASSAIGEDPVRVEPGRLLSCSAGMDRGWDGKRGTVTPTGAGPADAPSASLVVREDGTRAPFSTTTAPRACAMADEAYSALKSRCRPEDLRACSAWDGLPPRELRSSSRALEAAFPSGLVSRPLMLDEQGYLFGLMLFIGSFLAAVFALAAASLVFFRSKEDSAEDRGRYRSMIELGAPRSVVRRALLMQNAFSFGLPLVVGLCHAAFALAMLRNMIGFAVLGPGIAVSGLVAAAFFAAAGIATSRQEESICSRAAPP